MTPEQDDLVEHVAWLHREAEDCADLEGMGLYCQRLTKAAELITQLKEEVRVLEAHNKRLNQLMDGMDEYQADIEKTRPLAVEIINLRKGSKIMHEALGEANRAKDDLQAQFDSAIDTITQLQEQVTELENHNKDKSQLLANYKEQIKELVKQKYKAPPLPPIGIEKHRREK